MLERFRVDNLRNSSKGHSMKFKLLEPTIVRFSAPVHKHIEFDIELLEMTTSSEGTSKLKKLI